MKKSGLPLRFSAFLLLCAILIVTAGACSEPGADVSAETDSVTETTAAETELQSNLPDNLDYEGANARILNYNFFGEDAFVLNVTEQTGDIIYDAIYLRNEAVSERLNINFVFTDKHAVNGEDFGVLISSVIMANSDEYDIIHGVQYSAAQQLIKNYFLNIANLEYTDFDAPWWATDYIKEGTIGSKIFFASGDISLGHIRHMSSTFFNKTVYENYFGDTNDFYHLVYNGGWTLDKLGEYAQACYNDINGDGKKDNDDYYGGGVIVSNLTDHFTYDAGIRATTRNSEGIPELTMNNEKTVAFTQKLYSLFYENDGIHVYPPTEETNYITLPGKFQNNELLLLFGWLHISEYLRDMTADFGVIPFPKFDEAQPTYLSMPHDIATVYCLPVTCSTVEMSGAVMEAMAFEGYKSVIPAYYEVALKMKYFRDSDDMALQIVDMIHDNPVSDFAYIYNYALNNIGLVMRDLMSGKKSDFASHYAKIETGVQTKLDELVALYLEIE
ncbi:MAG: hypothetical protein PHZ09_04440 [Eubacteriales bacterium]|nr:hypothetical protein [Eubacteriales bacterium]